MPFATHNTKDNTPTLPHGNGNITAVLRTYRQQSLFPFMANIGNDPIAHGDELSQLFPCQEHVHTEIVVDKEWWVGRRQSERNCERLYALHNEEVSALVHSSIIAREYSRIQRHLRSRVIDSGATQLVVRLHPVDVARP